MFSRIIASSYTTIALLVAYAGSLATATFLEKYHGTAAAHGMIYYAPWFFVLQFLMVAHLIVVIVKRKLWRKEKWTMLTVHGALVVILCGALVSHVFGKEGVIRLREGDSTDRMIVHTPQGEAYHLLPFSITLEDFILTRYPGSSSPSSFESRLIVRHGDEVRPERVYMNNVLDICGYRIFQASFDRDERGTVLSINRDATGRYITYIGYFLLFFGLIAGFFAPTSRFSQLRRKLRGEQLPFVLLAGLFSTAVLPQAAGKEIPPSPMWEAVQRHIPDADHARRFGELPVQSLSGRMMPLNTFASEALRKLHRSERLGAFSSEQFLLSLMAMPDMWERIPFIALPGHYLAGVFHLTEPYCAYVEVFDSTGHYKLQEPLEAAYAKSPAERSRFDKDLIQLDERLQTLHQLFRFRLLRLFPLVDDPTHTWYAAGDDLSAFPHADSSFVTGIIRWYVEELRTALQTDEWGQCDELLGMISAYQQARNSSSALSPHRLRAELLYNNLNPFRTVRFAYLIGGFFMLILAFAALFRPQGRLVSIATRILSLGILTAFLYHLGGMSLRGYIAGNAPWSNAYETMVFAAAATFAAGLYFRRRSPLVFALATLFAGAILFVSGLNWMDPQINPLVPVLKSPWLMFHVSVIMAAYGFFGLSTLASLSCLLIRPFVPADRNANLSVINEMSLHIGLALMTIGTFLGAIWANESWGRYWGWDPKETWALITIVIYAALLHLRFLPRFRSERLFHLLTILAFATVLMTYFGVNYYLSGMHSYR
jgi:cytochrome c-type biogenesis protein CcsB